MKPEAIEIFRTVLSPFSLPDSAVIRLLEHWSLVQTWNKRCNLTSISSDAEAAWLHYYDSLMCLAPIDNSINTRSVVDIGSGAGYPGVPLAIARPELQITLLEPRQKRVSFLNVVKARLKLDNLQVLEGRTDKLSPPQRFDAAVTRATFSDTNDLASCLDWVAPSGFVLALRTTPSGASSEGTHYSVLGKQRYLEHLRPQHDPR